MTTVVAAATVTAFAVVAAVFTDTVDVVKLLLFLKLFLLLLLQLPYLLL
jgi:hypothetical protein